MKNKNNARLVKFVFAILNMIENVKKSFIKILLKFQINEEYPKEFA